MRVNHMEVAAMPGGIISYQVNALRLLTPVAYVGALHARLDSECSRKRCACGGVGAPRCTHVIEGASVLSIRRTWAKKKRACNHQPDPQAHMW
jgi:hypothetical protein